MIPITSGSHGHTLSGLKWPGKLKVLKNYGRKPTNSSQKQTLRTKICVVGQFVL